MQSNAFLLVFALAFASALAQDANLTAEEQAFTTNNIVPDVLPAFNPTTVLTATYTDPVTNQAVNVTPGGNLTIEQTTNRPQFSLTSSNASLSGGPFVVVMLDPDAALPTGSVAELRHLLAADMQFGTGENATILTNSTPAITNYLTPGPPPDAPAHRYTFLIYNQPDGFDTKALQFVNVSDDLTQREFFNVTDFAQKVGMGDPIAGTVVYVGNTTTNSTSGNGTSTGSASGSSGTAGAASSALTNLAPSTYFLALMIGGVYALF